MTTAMIKRHPLRMARESRNLTREQLAELTNVGSSTIKRAERGESINLHSRQQLCQFLEMTPQELGLIVNENDHSGINPLRAQNLELLLTMLQDGAVGDTIMGTHFDPTRRTLLAQMLGLAFLPTQQLLSLETKKPLTGMNTETLDQYEQLLQTCWQLSNKNSLEAVDQLLQISMPSISTFAQHSSPYQQRAAILASQAYQLAYIVASHHEDFNTSLAYCKQAKHYGEIARDPDLQAAALIRQGVTFLHRKSPFQSLESYQEALQQVNDLSPLPRARLYAALAEVQGKIGLEQDFRRSIGLAKESFSASSKDDPAALYVHFKESSLYLHEGLALLDLHKPEEAMNTFTTVDGLNPKMPLSERNRVDFLNQQAMAAGQLRDLDQFKIYMEASVSSAKALGSELRLSEAWDTYKRIQGQWGDEPRIKALTQIFHR